ncbi:hypothetical protein ACFPLB_04185 [Aquamicrobium segne]|uniref:Uncharacterized protein n=1 Tax=Aquamicrobium segne TaxID=469547 RepID=A0ABW0GXN1_9HYPH
MAEQHQAKFWMVYGMGQGAPVARHKTFDSARIEAERLARIAPGTRFYILETVGAAEKVDVQFIDLRSRDLDDLIPF